MSAFPIQRRVLANGVSTPITPPISCYRVQIMNVTGMPLRVYTTLDDETTYLEIADDFYQEFDFNAPVLRHTEVAFYLKAATDGTAIVIWK